MRVLLCHNYYQQPGGEDRVFAAEGALLESQGHEVLRYTVHNDRIAPMGRWDLFRCMLWNPQSYAELRALIRDQRPALMHCHNLFPLLSPSAYQAARDEGVPVVQTLHNYRLLCPSATLYRRGRPCESCVGRTTPWPGVWHACYRGSWTASAAAAVMLRSHRLQGTWTNNVDQYIALGDFARQKFVDAGFPPEKICVKPNFVHPERSPGDGSSGGAAFVGRLVPEKGLLTLLSAWSQLRADVRLQICGDGPLASAVKRAAAADPRITWRGQCSADEVHRALGDAACLIMPSEWYEPFGLTIVEAFAAGTPVIASRLGAMRELVADGRTGLHFTPGDATDLAAKVQAFFADRSRWPAMRRSARETYQQHYTAAANYRQLLEVYRRAGVTVEANSECVFPFPSPDHAGETISGVPTNV